MGLGRPAPRAPIMRASVGVISGRSATSRPPLSVNANSWPAISGPDLAVKSSRPSSTGPSISSKPAAREAARQADSIQRRTARSSGKKSRNPGRVWKRMARHRSPRISPSHPEARRRIEDGKRYHGGALVSEELAGLFNGENGAWVEALYEDYVLGRER